MFISLCDFFFDSNIIFTELKKNIQFNYFALMSYKGEVIIDLLDHFDGKTKVQIRTTYTYIDICKKYI